MPNPEELNGYNPENESQTNSGELKTAAQQIAQERFAQDNSVGTPSQKSESAPDFNPNKVDIPNQPANESLKTQAEAGLDRLGLNQDAKTPLKSALDIAKERSDLGGEMGPKFDAAQPAEKQDEAKLESGFENFQKGAKAFIEGFKKGWKGEIKSPRVEKSSQETDTQANPEENSTNPDATQEQSNTPETPKSSPEMFRNYIASTPEAKEAQDEADEVLNADSLDILIAKLIKLLQELKEKPQDIKKEAAVETENEDKNETVEESAEDIEESETEEKTSAEKKELWSKTFLKAQHINLPEKGANWLEADKKGQPTGMTRNILKMNWDSNPPTVQFEGKEVMPNGQVFTKKTNQPIGEFMKSSFEGEIMDANEADSRAENAQNNPEKTETANVPEEEPVITPEATESQPEVVPSAQESTPLRTSAEIATENASEGGVYGPEAATSTINQAETPITPDNTNPLGNIATPGTANYQESESQTQAA